MNVAITGASGFIGSHLLPAIAAHGWNVTAVTEPGDPTVCDRARSFPADIATGAGLDAALAGADAVIHLAARNHVLKETEKDPLATYRRINVEGTRNVVREASVAGVRTFVHLSSVKAMGEESDAAMDETSPCTPRTPYGISKLESEKVVGAEAERNGIRATILRLPMVYGPRNRGNLPRMIRWAVRGFPFPLFRPDNFRSMIYVENVVAGILATLKDAPEGVSTFILKDREDGSTRTLYTAICRELGKTPRFLSIPAAVVRFGGMLSEDFRKITRSFRVSSAKIEREIGFIPPVPLEEGIARTVAWYRRSSH